MTQLESNTEGFESKLVDGVVAVRLTGQAMKIVTEPVNSEFLDTAEVRQRVAGPAGLRADQRYRVVQPGRR